jgi:hypothetical protein
MKRRNFLAMLGALCLAPFLPEETHKIVLFPHQRKVLQDLYLSPEALEDIRKWGVDQIDKQTRKEIYACGGVTRWI